MISNQKAQSISNGPVWLEDRTWHRRREKEAWEKNAGVGLGKYRRALTPRLEKWIFLLGNEKPFGGLWRVGDIALFSGDYSGGLGKQERLEVGTPVRKLEHWLRGQALNT